MRMVMVMVMGTNMRMVDTTFGRYPLLPLREKVAEGRMRGRRRLTAVVGETLPDPSPAWGEGRVALPSHA